MNEAADALGRIETIDSERCTEHARKNFSSRKMADEPRRLYDNVVSIQHSARDPSWLKDDGSLRMVDTVRLSKITAGRYVDRIIYFPILGRHKKLN